MGNKYCMVCWENLLQMSTWMWICWMRWCTWSFMRKLWRSLLCILVAGIMWLPIILIIIPRMRSCFWRTVDKFSCVLVRSLPIQLRIVRSLCRWSTKSSCSWLRNCKILCRPGRSGWAPTRTYSCLKLWHPSSARNYKVFSTYTTTSSRISLANRYLCWR